MSHKPEFKTLEDFISWAEQYARERLKGADLPAIFCILSAKGSLIIMPAETSDAERKATSITVAKLFCIAHAARAVVFIAEAWASEFQASWPSQSPDRKEVVIISAEGFNQRQLRMLPSIRNNRAVFLAFGKQMDSAAANGPFVNILPDQTFTPEVQEVAQKVISELGLHPTVPSEPPLTAFDLYNQ